MEQDEDVAVAEASGGGNRLPPPVEVTVGDDPERRERRRIREEMDRRAEMQRIRDLDRRTT